MHNKNILVKRLTLIIIFFLITACSKSDRGELVGIKTNKFFPNKPQGMVLIPSGSYTMGPSNPNAALDQNPTLKTVSVKAFYMDETEITNSEYRQFVNWVRDSVVRHELTKAAYFKIGEDTEHAVRIDKFSDSSIDMYVRCFTVTDDWGEWLKVKERLAVKIKEIVESNGASFAFPSTSVYVEKK